jgi:hypothetical protein
MKAYESWVMQGQREAIEELVAASKTHWSALSSQMLDIYRKDPDDYANRLQILVENSKF